MKVGDKVVCVNFERYVDDMDIDGFIRHDLKPNKIYTIRSVRINNHYLTEKLINVEFRFNDHFDNLYYNKNRFKLLSEIRLYKINRLLCK